MEQETEPEFDAETLRSVERVCEPDPRSTMFARFDPVAGTWRTVELVDHHEAIAQFVLHAGVPDDVTVQFETARNLYLYAWFVYRFYPVAAA